MSLQAIVMAGGEGIRLRPLTIHTPKPLAPLLGEPTMGYALKLLKAHGMREIGVSLWYQPQKIRKAFGKGETYGVKLRYYEETEPLGTAGSVRLARKDLKSTFFVLSGDGLTDCDLTAALKFHQEKKALATLVLKRVGVPLPYGVVMTDKENRITRFIEKPTWSRVFSDLVNTGIYILEPDIFQYMADFAAPDFGKDVFPSLLAGGLPVYGFETKGYWCDIGDLKSYLQAQRDLLNGKVDMPHAVGIHESVRIPENARVEGKCQIGANTRIEPGAVIRDSVIGENCLIGSGARIENACLWNGAEVQQKARVSGSVLCDGAQVRQGAEVADGCAAGKKAVIGAYSLLRPGVLVCPFGKTAPGSVTAHSLNECESITPQWSAQGVECASPVQTCEVCGAYVKTTGVRRVIAGHRDAAALSAAAAGALASYGVQVYAAGNMTAPLLQTVIEALGLDGGVFAAGHSLRFFQRHGTILTGKQRASMDACVLRQELPASGVDHGCVIPFSGAELVYFSALLPKEQTKSLYSPLAIFCDDKNLQSLVQEGLRRIGALDVRVGSAKEAEVKPGETGFLLPDSGEDVTVFSAERALRPEEKIMLLLSLCHRKTGKLFDLPGTPQAAREIAPLELPDDSESCQRQGWLLRDGLAALLFIAEALKDGPLDTFMRDVPVTHILSMDVPCGIGMKGRVLHTLCGQTALPYTLDEGMRIDHPGGFVRIVPDAYQPSVRVTGEAADSEFAKELCDFYFRKIQDMTKAGKRTQILP